MPLTIRVNEQCLVRHQDCKRIFAGSRICFVACPNSDEIALELDIIRQKLRAVNIEPYIATDQRDFQKDIFCEKICTKIIESQFCIVILNDVVDPKDSVRKPNANVYYEYGLMTAFRKRIIPIQLAGQSLAFNIQSLDTLKYQAKEFSRQIEDAIKVTLLSIEAEQKEKTDAPRDDNPLWAVDLMGLVRADDRFRLRHERAISSRSLGFDPYQRARDGRLYYVGVFPADEGDKDVVLRAKMLTVRIKNYTDQLRSDIEQLKATAENRVRSLAAERMPEQEKLLSSLLEVAILVSKPGIGSSAAVRREYRASVKDVGLALELDVLEDARIRELLATGETAEQKANNRPEGIAKPRRLRKPSA